MTANPSHDGSLAGPAAQGRMFWCFISYRHADNGTKGREWATWLHHELETYEIPGELVGSTNDRGDVIPERIYPVFRDEEELPAYADLSSAILHALAHSRSLIVICSPSSRKSKFVNEEVARFKALGRTGRVCGMVIRGVTETASVDCALPLPLVRRVERDATVSGVAESPVLADFRDPSGAEEWLDPSLRLADLAAKGLSPELAREESAKREARLEEGKLFLIAWVLGVSFQRLRDAEERKRRSLRRSRYLVIGFWFTLAVAGILAAWQGVRIATGIRQQASVSFDNAELTRLAAEKTLREAAIKQAEAGKAKLEFLYAEAVGLAQAQRWREAAGLLRQACDGGHPAAMFELAKLLDEGRGVAADRPAAIGFLEKAEAAGHAPSRALLGRLLSLSPGDRATQARGISLLRRAVAEGDVSVRLDLAKALIPSARSEAIGLLRLEAKTGVPEASWLLGTLLKEDAGTGRVPDGQVPEWYVCWLKAADSGWVPAKRDAGCAFWSGEVGPISAFAFAERLAALRRLIQAAHGGDKAASACLAGVYAKSENHPMDDAEREEFLTLGAKAGVAKASFDLAELFAEKATTPDSSHFLAAMEWYGRARQSGLSEPAMLRQATLMMRAASGGKSADRKLLLSNSLAFFRQVAGSGNVEAMLGAAEAVQLLDAPDASAQAEVWLRKAEATGDNKARRTLAAWIIRSGKDGREAAELLRRGMGLRDAEAALVLGDWMFSHAKTRERLAKTFDTYAEGAEFGSGTCAMRAAAMLRKGQGVGVDLSRAERLELRAAQCGDPLAMMERGRLLLESGEPKVLAESFAWLQEAASAGKSAECAPYLARLASTMEDSQRAAAADFRKQIRRGIATIRSGQER